MSDETRNLTPKQLKAIAAALLTTNTKEEAAEAAGVSPATLRRWLKDDRFREEYRDERYRVVGHVVGELLARASAAVDTLGEGLEDPDSGARLRAARSILDYVLKGAELDRKMQEMQELVERMDAIEEALSARKKGWYNGGA